MGRYNIVLLFLISVSCGLSQSIRKTEWTKQEVVDWYEKKHSTWNGILYQGSNDDYHFFISRVFDEFVFIRIKRSELFLEDEKIYHTTSSSGLGYYYVNPSNNFQKISNY